MWYAIIGRDSPESLSLRASARDRHLGRLRTLCEQGRLLTAGPLPAIDSTDPGPAGYAGSLVVADFANLAEAQAWAQEDPYIEAGAWQGAEVHPYNAVLP
ncbi:MAG: YciI family protein [Wenzhouxiangella sp.]|nr:YciI family protein [Wenzhouxiangella sp.]